MFYLFAGLSLRFGENFEEEEAVAILLLHPATQDKAAPDDGDGVEVDKEHAHTCNSGVDLDLYSGALLIRIHRTK